MLEKYSRAINFRRPKDVNFREQHFKTVWHFNSFRKRSHFFPQAAYQKFKFSFSKSSPIHHAPEMGTEASAESRAFIVDFMSFSLKGHKIVALKLLFVERLRIHRLGVSLIASRNMF